MHTVKTQISFEAAHRLYDVDTYSTECADNIHGHSYKVNVECGCDDLNDAGMVLDFKLFKKILHEVIEDKYDHSCILRDCDPLKDAIVANCKKVHVVTASPTAEWMACQFALDIDVAMKQAGIRSDVRLLRVEVQETENNIASWTAMSRISEMRR